MIPAARSSRSENHRIDNQQITESIETPSPLRGTPSINRGRAGLLFRFDHISHSKRLFLNAFTHEKICTEGVPRREGSFQTTLYPIRRSLDRGNLNIIPIPPEISCRNCIPCMKRNLTIQDKLTVFSKRTTRIFLRI